MARWVTQMATGLPKDHPSDATTLETLHLVRLKQAAERSGLLQVWRAHEELRKQSRASPNRMYPQAREALNTLFFVESRYRSHGHLHAFSDLLARNDSKFFSAITSRLQVIFGEHLSSDALLNRGRALREREQPFMAGSVRPKATSKRSRWASSELGHYARRCARKSLHSERGLSLTGTI
jgi:hypothetical protein